VHFHRGEQGGASPACTVCLQSLRRDAGQGTVPLALLSLVYASPPLVHLLQCRPIVQYIFSLWAKRDITTLGGAQPATPVWYGCNYLSRVTAHIFNTYYVLLPTRSTVQHITMDADRRLAKALEAANDALQHLSITADFGSLDCTHIDRLLGRVVDLPTEGNQRNSRRNLLVIRQWMISEGPGVVLLEVLGQLYWRLGELNSNQFEKFKAALQQRQPYVTLVKDANAVALVIQRIRYIQRSKADACQDFLSELSDLIGAKGMRFTVKVSNVAC